MFTKRFVAVVGSREFHNYPQLHDIVEQHVPLDDAIVSGGATGADSMAQRFAKEFGKDILIRYPRWVHGKSAGFERNRLIVESADLVLAFYAKGRYRQGGTLNTANWAEKMGVPLLEFEED